MGAMKLVAASHTPEELNLLGMHMYVSVLFRYALRSLHLCQGGVQLIVVERV
jgi:hypothetical protein